MEEEEEQPQQSVNDSSGSDPHDPDTPTMTPIISGQDVDETTATPPSAVAVAAATTTQQQHDNNNGGGEDHNNGGSSGEYNDDEVGGEAGITTTTSSLGQQQQQPGGGDEDEEEMGEEALDKYGGCGSGSCSDNNEVGGSSSGDAVDCYLGDYQQQQGNNLIFQIPSPAKHNNKQQPPPSPTTATTPEPQPQAHFPQQPPSLSLIPSPWYSLATTTPSPLATMAAEDSKTYRAYIQSIDKCLKNFEYSIEWPDLISALSKLNKVISSYNATIATQQQQQQQPTNNKSSSPQPQQQPQPFHPPQPPPPLPRTTLITKRLSQCLHPNLPSGVHLKTLETFDLIFKGFRPFNYIHLEADLFSFTSGLLPLWSYAAISVKPKLLGIYEDHLVELGERLRPALAGILLSLFNGLVDDGVEQDIKIRIQSLLSTLQTNNPSTYHPTLLSLISSHPSIHLPILTHIIQINYTPPPPTLMALISSPNTLVQRNALDLLLKSSQFNQDTRDNSNSNNNTTTTQVTLTKTVLQSLLKRDMSITRRVFNFIEPRPRDLLIQAIHSLIQDPQTDGHSLTRILSSLLDNPNIQILDQILAPVVKYLMKCEYSTSIAFLSTVNSTYLSSHFTSYLFEAVGGGGSGCHGDTQQQLEELENRVIIFNYIVKLRLFELDWASFFSNFLSDEDGSSDGCSGHGNGIMNDDAKLRVILQMVRLHYNSHHDSFLPFYNSFMAKYFRLEEYDRVVTVSGGGLATTDDVSDGWFSLPNNSKQGDNCNNAIATPASFTSTCFEYVCELMQRSDPSTSLPSQKYIILSACTPTPYTDASIRTFITFQTLLQPLLHHPLHHQQSQATFLIFKHCYDNNKPLLNSLNYPEKYLLSELKSDRELREVTRLDLSRSPLVVLKLVDPGTMGGSCYRRFVAKEFVRGSPGLVLGAVLKYLEFHPQQQQQQSFDEEAEGQEGTPSNSHFKQFKYCSGVGGSSSGSGPSYNNRAKSESNLLLEGAVDSEDGGSGSRMTHANSVRNLNNNPKNSVASSCYYDSARVSTLLEKLEFVLDVNEEGFLASIDLVVLLSKLTVLATVQNCSHGDGETDEDDEVITLEIQTRALRLIGRIVRAGVVVAKTDGDGAENGVVVATCSQYSFVYDSLLAYLNGGGGGAIGQQQQHRGGGGMMTRRRSREIELLWELAAVDVICNFFKFDLENYSLALVVQKCLSGSGTGGSGGNSATTTAATTTGTSETRIRELEESLHIRWLKGIGAELGSLKRHLNALVLISFTNVCRNLLEEGGWSDYYWEESLAFLDVLMRFVLGGCGGGGGSGIADGGSSAGSSGGGFLSSLFGGSSAKDSVVDNEREALRTALLGKVDLVLKICCRWWGRRRGRVGGPMMTKRGGGVGLPELVRYLGDHHEGEVMGGILKCFDVAGLEYVCKEMLGVGGGKVCAGICSGLVERSNNSSNNNEKVLEGINFLVRYLKIENSRSPSSLDVGGVVNVCKLGGSTRHTLLLVTEYLMRCGGGGSGGASNNSNKAGMKELQDLVVRTIEMGVERREFWVLESYVPAIFDLVWGGGGGGGSFTSGGCSGEGAGSGGDVDSLCSTATTTTTMTTGTTTTGYGSVIGGGSISSSSSASNASVREQKVIVNTVHGVVVAVLVAVKGSLTGSSSTNQSKQQQLHHDSNTTTHSNNNYTSALKVMEQISHHSYLRKAWKKEVFDLITSEPTFFYFTPECLAIWKVVVDNLFTQDRSTFSELITRLTQTSQLSTTSTLSTIIFSSRDSELCETRACLLKRLAFVIHSSEKDQYAKYITNIQEKIAEALKIGSGGGGGGGLGLGALGSGDYYQLGAGGGISNGLLGVSNSVFLCFRIMVLKFNANILVSLWPIIVHEVVMVLNSLQAHMDELLAHHNNTLIIAQQQQQAQQASSSTTEQQQQSRTTGSSGSGEDTSTTTATTTSTQPLPPSAFPHLLPLYLQTLKLLNFLFTIPSSDSQIPHFQLYKWAFTDVVVHGNSRSVDNDEQGQGQHPNNNNNPSHLFIPYIRKLINSARVLYPNSMTATTTTGSNNSNNNQQSATISSPPLRVKAVRVVEELCGTLACLDVVVPEGEWEVVDFCDGGVGCGGCSSGEDDDDNGNVGNTNL